MKRKPIRQYQLHTLIAAVAAVAALASVTTLAAVDLSRVEKVQLCHHDGTGAPGTIEISGAAAEAHLRLHPGDYIGQCPVEPEVQAGSQQYGTNQGRSRMGQTYYDERNQPVSNLSAGEQPVAEKPAAPQAVDGPGQAEKNEVTPPINAAAEEQSTFDRFLGKLPVTGISIGLIMMLAIGAYYATKSLLARR